MLKYIYIAIIFLGFIAINVETVAETPMASNEETQTLRLIGEKFFGKICADKQFFPNPEVLQPLVSEAFFGLLKMEYQRMLNPPDDEPIVDLIPTTDCQPSFSILEIAVSGNLASVTADFSEKNDGSEVAVILAEKTESQKWLICNLFIYDNGELVFDVAAEIPMKNLPKNKLQTNERVLTISEIENMSKFELDILRNEIYARHGYIFKRKDLNEYFLSQPWYQPTQSDMKAIEKLLTDTEKYNANFILNFQKKAGQL